MEFNFNTNRAEAERWLSTAVKLLSAHDLQGTKTFAIRARETDPRLEATEQIIAVADTLLAAESQINNQNQQPDWYAILQLAQYTQNLEIVATQYRRLALLLNPHRNRFPYADHAFRLVSEAWNVLSNPTKKAMYDHELSMFNRFDSPPSGSTQLFERQFLQMHHVQQQPPQPPPPPPPQPLLFHPQPSQLLQFQPQPPPQPQPQSQPEVQRPQPQWNFQQKRQQPPPEQQHQQQHHQQHHHEPPQHQQQQQQQYQELPQLWQQLQQQHQQQEVSKNPRSKDGRPSMEEERPIPIPINSTPPPSESTGPVESTPPSESAPPSELTRPQTVSKTGSFWTACPYCYNLFEYPSAYEDCMLRCQNCKRAFNAMAIAAPPQAGKDVNFCCWGYFPLGLLENSKDTGGSAEVWTPFSTMFACPIQGKKNTARAKIANSGPRVYYDDEEALLDVSDPSEDSDDDDEWQRVRRKKRVVKAKAKASTAKTPVRASDRLRKGSQNAGGQGKEGTGGSKKSTSGARKRSAAALGKLDLNVEFSNNEGEEPAAQTMSEGNGTANGEEDNMEGIGFFEGLDEFLSSLPILNVVGDDKPQAWMKIRLQNPSESTTSFATTQRKKPIGRNLLASCHQRHPKGKKWSMNEKLLPKVGYVVKLMIL
ncbi:formin-J-like [Pyrus ussuriensis x Pyrus communis]|uniref:Formin-J-like n=1 Tax=Pyrus ussuriensis x Pyrus communis TaxID=2448454 RepID=A0A5N5FJK9_9ROSA|nr:formin-J-like [Pyrus ussuriensis x Pyrus communis]